MAGMNRSTVLTNYSSTDLLDTEEEKAERLIKKALGDPPGSDGNA